MKSFVLQIGLTFGVLYSAFGQGFYTPQTNTTPYGSYTTYQYHYMPSYYGGNNGPVSTKCDYKIVLKNDSIVEVFAKINIKDAIQSISFKRKKERFTITPSDTKEIICASYFQPTKGIPADSCWLFKSFSGAITAYSYLPEPGTMFIVAVQKGKDGPIVALTEDALLDMVADNPKALKKVNDGKFVDAIKIYNKK